MQKVLVLIEQVAPSVASELMSARAGRAKSSPRQAVCGSQLCADSAQIGRLSESRQARFERDSTEFRQ
jgi:hypothetical protein